MGWMHGISVYLSRCRKMMLKTSQYHHCYYKLLNKFYEAYRDHQQYDHQSYIILYQLYIHISIYHYIINYITLSLMCGLWVLYHHQHHTSMAPSGTVASQVKVLRPGEDDSMQGKSDLAWFLSYPYWSCLTMFNLDIHSQSLKNTPALRSDYCTILYPLVI